MNVDDEIKITANPSSLSRSILTLDVMGVNEIQQKTVFSGTIDAMITKDIIRKLRTEQPELVSRKGNMS